MTGPSSTDPSVPEQPGQPPAPHAAQAPQPQHPSPPSAYPPYPTGANQSGARPPVRSGDMAATIVLSVIGGGLMLVVAFMSIFLVAAGSSCGKTNVCDTGLMSAGWYLAMFGPVIVFAAAVAWAIVRLVRRRLAWWLPLVGLVAGFVVWFIAIGVIQAGISAGAASG